VYWLRFQCALDQWVAKRQEFKFSENKKVLRMTRLIYLKEISIDNDIPNIGGIKANIKVPMPHL